MNKDTLAVMDFLCEPQNVKKMIEASNNHSPALSAVVGELEERFAYADGFPLNTDNTKNAANRRNVGWMVRYVMREYGYYPIKSSDKTRIGRKTGAKYFQNASLYQQVKENADYITHNVIFMVGKCWKEEDMEMDESDVEYEEYRRKTLQIKEDLISLNISEDFLFMFLQRLGYKNLISKEKLVSFLSGTKVPCIELYDTINTIIRLVDAFDKV